MALEGPGNLHKLCFIPDIDYVINELLIIYWLPHSLAFITFAVVVYLMCFLYRVTNLLLSQAHRSAIFKCMQKRKKLVLTLLKNDSLQPI